MSKFLHFSEKNNFLSSIDGHAHVFTRHLKMLRNRRYTPHRDALPSTYSRILSKATLYGGLLVQPSFLGTDNHYLLRTLQNYRSNNCFWGVCVIPPTTSKRQMANMAKAGVVGTRLNLIGHRTPNLKAKNWQQFLKNINELGWHLEIHAEGHKLAVLLPHVLNACRHVVVDHFGLPNPSAPHQCAGWRTILSTKKGLWVKVSAPYRVFPNTKIGIAVDKCTVLAQALREHLGTERMIWGSDWPWTQHENGIKFSHTIDWREQWLHSSDGGIHSLLQDAIEMDQNLKHQESF